MTAFKDEAALITVRVSIKGNAGPAFIDWQGKLNSAITSSEGFISLEIIRASLSNTTWFITQRFISPKQADAWNGSAACVSLMGELNELALRGSMELLPATSGVSQGGVTEVFVTDVPQNHMASFKEWNAKIHLEEAKHLGFKGVYVQSPIESKGKHWITMLQFDTVQNLDKWLESPERAKLLEEAVAWLPSLEAHRVVSPYDPDCCL